MNLENLRKLFNESNENLVIKNYKELCKVLEVEPRDGSRNKKYHLREMERHFKFEQDGRKFIIKDIYTIQKENKRGRGMQGKFTNDLQDIFLRVLSQSEKGELLFSKGMLFKQANLVNKNYAIAKRNIPKLSEITQVEEDVCYDFFNNTNDKMISYVETALKRLRSRRLIVWEKVMVVAKYSTIKNQLGESILHIVEDENGNWNANATAYIQHRQATYEEKQAILKIEKETLKEMGFKDTQEAFLRGKWFEYKNNVNAILQERLNIKFHYEGYLITYNHEDIVKELSDDITIINSKNNVNANIVNTLKTNAKTRHNNAIDRIKEIESNVDLLDIYSKSEIEEMHNKANTTKRKKKVRFEVTQNDLMLSKDTFVDKHNKIVDVVIEQLAFDLREKLVEKPSKVKAKVEETFNEELPF